VSEIEKFVPYRKRENTSLCGTRLEQHIHQPTQL